MQDKLKSLLFGPSVKNIVWEFIIISSIIATISYQFIFLQTASVRNLTIALEALLVLDFVLRVFIGKRDYIYSWSAFFDFLGTVSLIPFTSQTHLLVFLRAFRIVTRLLRAFKHQNLFFSGMNSIHTHLGKGETINKSFKRSFLSLLSGYLLCFILFVGGIILSIWKLEGSMFIVLEILLIVAGIIGVIILESIRNMHTYAITNSRLIYSEGLLSKQIHSVSLNMISDVKLEQTLRMRLLGIGTIHVRTPSENSIILQNVFDPVKIKRSIHDQTNN